MRIRSLRAWMGTLSGLTRLTLLGLMVVLALACGSGSNNNNSQVGTNAPAVDSFAASPSTITAGQSCELYWVTTGATTADGTIALPTTLTITQDVGSTSIGIVNSYGSTIVSPTATTVYTLTAAYEGGTIPGTTTTYSGGSTTATVTITVVPAVPGTLSVFAGVPVGAGNVDGLAAGAGFGQPTDVAWDGNSALYVTDSTNNTIRKITTGANSVVSTFAGQPGQSGTSDGTGLKVTFNNPSALSVDSTGNLYVADTGSNTIRLITAAGVVSTIAGKHGTLAGSTDGKGQAARFNSPYGIAVDRTNNLIYVADSYNHTIRKITPTANPAGGTDYLVSTFAGTASKKGSTDATGASARFTEPTGLAVDTFGNVYVADSGNNIIRMITPAGVVSTLAGTAPVVTVVNGTTTVSDNHGAANGKGPAASFSNPYKLSVDGSGNVYVADMGNHAIRMITSDGTVSTLAGLVGNPGFADGGPLEARFSQPFAVAADASGHVFVADTGNKILREIASGPVVSTIAGTASPSGNHDAAGMDARFNNPGGLAVDADGYTYLADSGNNSIRKITPAGVVSTFVNGQSGLSNPAGVALDKDGNLYVANSGDHTIRKITPAGVVSILAGSPGQSGVVDATGDAARFNAPSGVAVDKSNGYVYVADYGNHLIRQITAAGVVTTFAGHVGTSDGTTTGTPMGFPGAVNAVGNDAYFFHPHSLVVDASSNVYVADMDNHVIRAITPGRLVTTLAGILQSAGNTDDLNASARFYWPSALALDAGGNLYVADKGNNTIRKVTTDATTGHVTTIVGLPGRVINTTGPLPASLDAPSWVAVDPSSSSGNLFLAIQDAILKVTFE